jgi:hypothetical protein
MRHGESTCGVAGVGEGGVVEGSRGSERECKDSYSITDGERSKAIGTP